VTPGAGGTYVVDRWLLFASQASKVTAQVLAGTLPGCARELRLTVAAAHTAAASEVFTLRQSVEGYDVADCGLGAAGASALGLSFQAQSSVSGTYTASLRNNAGARSHLKTFALTANVATAVALVFPGDTAGTWLKDTGAGVIVTIDLGSGSNFQAAPDAWAAGNHTRTDTSGVNWLGTLGATFRLSNVQLERLPAANAATTPFERRSVAAETMLARRYYQTNSGTAYNYATGAGSTLYSTCPLSPPMRVAPTATYVASGGTGYSSSGVVSTGPTDVVGQVTSSAASAVVWNYAMTATAEL
jgi:hypothetical protein